ncbi:MAG: TIGR01459 family HAD-type hydrolase [SAR324 cluster bacterium]|nr:TIGR01459 family HAD-type hydrolase [SAR324 cluster bacterium]
MNECRYIDSIKEVVDNYDCFIIDQWGVLHDGEKPYYGAIEMLEFLKGAKKIIMVLTNSGRRSAENFQKLADIGFDIKLFDEVLSSGEAFFLYNNTTQFSFTKGKAFHISSGENPQNNTYEGLKFTTNIEKARWIFLSGINFNANLTYYKKILASANQAKLPLICVNGDYVIVNPNRQTFVGPGQLALDYQQKGGKVYYFGKPHAYVYELCQQRLPSSISKSRTLCIGDSLEHDIKGANDNNYDSLLIGEGIFFHQFNQQNPAQIMPKLTNKYKVFPNLYCFSFG